MLNIMEAFPLGQQKDYGYGSAKALHAMIEAKKLAYADLKKYIGEPRGQKLPVATLLSKEHAAARAKLIDPDRANCDVSADLRVGNDTTFLTVVDRDGNMVSLIQSNFNEFGSGIVAPETGFVLHNRGALFTLEPDSPNLLAGHKRPLHTIIPSLVTKNGRATMPFGVMGGQYQPVGQVHVLTNMLDYGCDVQEAIDMPRGLHYEGVYQLEDGVPAEIVDGLKKLGHKTTSVVGPLGGGQAIWIDWDKGTLTGGSDPRKDGCALGY